jgi:peptidylprolyl isomerase
MRHLTIVSAAAITIGLVVAGCGGSNESSTIIAAAVRTTTAPVVRGVKPKVVVPPGPPPDHLVVEDLREGEGRPARRGHKLTVQFVALSWDGKPFQSSWDGGRVDPFTFRLRNNPREVVPGWERGIPGLREGGRRELIVPPKLLYRPNQPPPETVGPKNTLVYVVEALRVH